VVVIASDADAVEAVHAIATELRRPGLRVSVDDRTDIDLGTRTAKWTVKGIPFRIEVGQAELLAESAVLIRRLSGARRTTVPLRELYTRVAPALIEDEQRAMLHDARVERDARIVSVDTVAEARDAAATGWARVPWSALGEAGEAELARSGVTVRCLQRRDGSVPDSDDDPDLVALVARSH
jgi:prolyl-tRNA synthetase